MSLSRISCEQAHELMHNSCCQILDIRDPQSYQLSRPAGAKPLDNNTLPAFLNEADRQAPTLVFCYHGNSSQQAALFLQQEGFTEVHSVDGGFELWRQLYPNDIES
ncbi:thiosulfate sulfurtransferase GlpE [Aestuariicella hydrocarbonica]|uniref:Thiosulfate sulfurtransferase GlpE n=1 Tax=Pseudomaricurvus hydrocarbonicus TaxID=1470433 RepID=A0A9E5T4E8_9GAMM|nr:thiosulfate sulfurtransferase GlpE [Aestuariicella hydrocarbonica]NHO68028.1 thiosulfate sulfurtransferase GlpE [Aestuariicella hydrocarbonica]